MKAAQCDNWKQGNHLPLRAYEHVLEHRFVHDPGSSGPINCVEELVQRQRVLAEPRVLRLKSGFT